ncbi:MAG: hypothetical protein HQ518_21845 [Rhodopirellula sp.]|nr:hypothetical protein [Rhodopirellula sp.]
MKEYTTVEEQIEYGLDTIDMERTVEVRLRDLMYVHQTMAELNRFFHQPLHYPDLEEVKRFIGTVDGGAYRAIHRCLYDVMRNMLPKDIDEAFGDGERFDHPNFPYYYDPKAEHDASQDGESATDSSPPVS